MHSPENYKSLSMLYSGIRGQIGAAYSFGKAVAGLTEVFVATDDGEVRRVSIGTVHRTDENDPLSFAFIDTVHWTIDLSRVREASREFGGSLHLGASILTADWVHADGGVLWPPGVEPKIAEFLEKFERCPLVIPDGNVDGWFDPVRERSRLPPPLPIIDYSDQSALAEGFQVALHRWPIGQPKKRDDFENHFFEFTKLRGKTVAREVRRNLWREYATGDWIKPGPKRSA